MVDRASQARRQPGSAVKPLLLLNAFDGCGSRKPLHAATRVSDGPLRIELPSGRWEPVNFDNRFHGTVDIRTALRESYNLPFVRIARWCGADSVAGPMRGAGLQVPRDPPPSFALGAIEVTPLEMAGAFTVFATPGRAREPFALHRVERPSGRGLEADAGGRRRIARSSSAYIIRELLRDAVENGTGRAAV